MKKEIRIKTLIVKDERDALCYPVVLYNEYYKDFLFIYALVEGKKHLFLM
jgi:hypothetical protein